MMIIFDEKNNFKFINTTQHNSKIIIIKSQLKSINVDSFLGQPDPTRHTCRDADLDPETDAWKSMQALFVSLI